MKSEFSFGLRRTVVHRWQSFNMKVTAIERIDCIWHTINSKSEFSYGFCRTAVHHRKSAKIKNQSDDNRKYWSYLSYIRSMNSEFSYGFARTVVHRRNSANIKNPSDDNRKYWLHLSNTEKWNLIFHSGFAGLSSIVGNLLTSKIKVKTIERFDPICHIISMKSEFSYGFRRIVVHRRKSANIKSQSYGIRKYWSHLSYNKLEIWIFAWVLQDCRPSQEIC